MKFKLSKNVVKLKSDISTYFLDYSNKKMYKINNINEIDDKNKDEVINSLIEKGIIEVNE